GSAVRHGAGAHPDLPRQPESGGGHRGLQPEGSRCVRREGGAAAPVDRRHLQGQSNLMLIRRLAGAAAVALCAGLAAPATPPRAPSSLPPSALAIERDGGAFTWWRSERAPTRWTAPLPDVAGALHWQRVAPGITWASMRLAGHGEAWRIRVMVVRIDPRLVRFRLDTAFNGTGMAAAWSIARAPNDALVALNAGQFVGSMPWGWVVLHGRQFLSPGHGPLSTAVVIDTAGRVHWISGDSLAEPISGVEAAFSPTQRCSRETAACRRPCAHRHRGPRRSTSATAMR